jgi:signal transduction histidine kinase
LAGNHPPPIPPGRRRFQFDRLDAHLRGASSGRRPWVVGLLVGTALVAALSGVMVLLKPHVPLSGLSVLYLLAVLAVAVEWGVVLAVVVSIESALVFTLLAPPAGQFRLNDRADAIALGVSLVTGLVAGQLGAQLRHKTRESALLAAEQAALRRIATLVAQATPSAEIFEAVTREVGMLSDAELARMERDESDGTVTGVAAWSRTEGHLAVGTRFALVGVSIAALVRETGRPMRVDTFAGALGPIAEEARALGIRSSVGCPIVVGGTLWGVIAASSKREAAFPPAAESRIDEFTRLVATAVANAEDRAEIAASRARVVAAADETRRRIERDLHDGAQQRLVSLALRLRALASALPPGTEAVGAELADLGSGLGDVLDDLREISRGIHPAILTRGGLGPALKSLARRSTVPVELNMSVDQRLPAAVEVAAYYVVAEGLTNVAKHARASVIGVDVVVTGASLRIAVRDDGMGGADTARGSGLIGLKDRVEAVGGDFAVESPIGAGTALRVDLPVFA